MLATAAAGLRMQVLHLIAFIFPVVIIVVPLAEAAADGPDDVAKDEVDQPQSQHCYSCHPHRLWGHNQEDAEGHLGKAKEDDKEAIDPVEPLPAHPVLGLLLSLLDMWTATKRGKMKRLKGT